MELYKLGTSLDITLSEIRDLETGDIIEQALIEWYLPIVREARSNMVSVTSMHVVRVTVYGDLLQQLKQFLMGEVDTWLYDIDSQVLSFVRMNNFVSLNFHGTIFAPGYPLDHGEIVT